MDHHAGAEGPIDAVITWVNGASASHLRARRRYMAEAGRPLHENAINPHRWNSADEILYCLHSIESFAPWTRKIWIVVDGERPDLSELSEALRAKIGFAYHREIFGGFGEALPTFNSLAIESLLWRIEGLAERFMYFNDDVFLTAPLLPCDVFEGGGPVLRGKWVDCRERLARPDAARDPALFHMFMQVNAAAMAGFGVERVFSAAHVVHPMCRSVMADLFERHEAAFAENVRHRFRDLGQFLPQGLHNHACIAAGRARVLEGRDHLHIRSGQGVGRAATETWTLLQGVRAGRIKFLCVNDLPQLEEVIPEVRQWLSEVVGGLQGMARRG